LDLAFFDFLLFYFVFIFCFILLLLSAETNAFLLTFFIVLVIKRLILDNVTLGVRFVKNMLLMVESLS